MKKLVLMFVAIAAISQLSLSHLVVTKQLTLRLLILQQLTL